MAGCHIKKSLQFTQPHTQILEFAPSDRSSEGWRFPRSISCYVLKCQYEMFSNWLYMYITFIIYISPKNPS